VCWQASSPREPRCAPARTRSPSSRR